jgi:hypothetical protein
MSAPVDIHHRSGLAFAVRVDDDLLEAHFPTNRSNGGEHREYEQHPPLITFHHFSLSISVGTASIIKPY